VFHVEHFVDTYMYVHRCTDQGNRFSLLDLYLQLAPSEFDPEFEPGAYASPVKSPGLHKEREMSVHPPVFTQAAWRHRRELRVAECAMRH